MLMVQERVQRGMKLLDEKRPGWWKEIDLGKLCIISCNWCVLGQLYGYFERGLDKLDLWGYSRIKGFSFSDEADGHDLTEEWAEQIRLRQQERRLLEREETKGA